MPQVTGTPLAQAEQALKAAGFSYDNPTGQTSTSIPVGVVIATNPVAGAYWAKDSAIHLVVSQGPPLPGFVGLPVTAAQAQAAAGGYSINQVPVTNSSQPPGTVLRQEPQQGTPITSGEVVTVYVSAPAQGNVPNVVGMSQQDATNALTAAGFQVNVTGFGNKVADYNPKGQAPQGSTITITMGIAFP
jgi:serine/threonine-protein kinase